AGRRSSNTASARSLLSSRNATALCSGGSWRSAAATSWGAAEARWAAACGRSSSASARASTGLRSSISTSQSPPSRKAAVQPNGAALEWSAHPTARSAPMPPTDAALLTGFRLRNAEQRLGVHGVHVHREGHPPVEHRFRADDTVEVYSASKTFVAVAVGIARAEGLLGLDDAVVEFFPGAPHADGAEAMTVRHLLHMSSGSTATWHTPVRGEEPDLLGAFLTAELVAEPGSRFFYSNACSYVLGRIVHAVSGQDLRDYLVPRLFDPLGIGNPQWLRCPQGHSLGGVGLQLRTSELARLGRLLLQDGRWEGSSLVPADFVAAMHGDVVT